MLLEIKGIAVHYDRLRALEDVSIEAEEGGIVTIIGGNGAGKSTTLRAVSGLNHPSSGEIWFQGQRIDRLPPAGIVKLGIAQVPEGRQLFPQMTVAENLYTGAFLRKDKDGVNRDLERVFAHFPVLKQRQSQLAGTLSGGEQQMLAVGRALMSHPRLLLLDEPSLGLSPIMVRMIAKIIREIHKEGVTIVLVEQNTHMALGLATRGYVLETGRVVLDGTGEELLDNEMVKTAFLGG